MDEQDERDKQDALINGKSKATGEGRSSSGDASVLEPWIAKIDEQSYRNVSGAQVVDHLGFVLRCQTGHRLEFNYYFFPNQQISVEFAHELAAKMYVNRHLRSHRQPTFPKRNCKSIFVHRFQKSGAKLVADIKSASYYAFSKIRMEKTIISFIPFILFIHVNFLSH